ncbi:conjugal transfer pilus assembly protein TraB, partial [Salmonella enterica subsp. enterica serovar Enteritidis str. 62-1976]
EQEPVPDMTGVVDTTFDDKVRQHATTEMQVTAAQMRNSTTKSAMSWMF